MKRRTIPLRAVRAAVAWTGDGYVGVAWTVFVGLGLADDVLSAAIDWLEGR